MSVRSNMDRAVRFTRFGGPEVLEVVSRAVPEPGPLEVRVQVVAAGLNPVDYKIFSGRPTFTRYDVVLPSGNGYDFSGVVDAVGSDVSDWSVGDRVFGGLRFQAQADHLVINPAELVRMPAGMDFDVAGALNVTGRTAVASVRAVAPRGGETVLVSGAAGGVGFLTAQLAQRQGATVIGTAGEANQAWLAERGIVPVVYGPGLAERVREVAPLGVDAVLDTQGRETVAAGIELGVERARINSVADYPAIEELGICGVGGASAGVRELAEVAELFASGALTLTIAGRFPLEEVADAYRTLMDGHVRGKLILHS